MLLLREQGAVIGTEQAQIVGAAALHEPQIIGVIDDAREVGVLVIDPHRHEVAATADLAVETAPVEVKGASIMLRQRVMREDETLVEARVRVAFVSGGRARPIPKPLRLAMQADQDMRADRDTGGA